MPVLSAVRGAEERGVFHSGINHVRVVERRLQMPDTLEFPSMLRTIVPLVGRQRLPGFRRRVVDEFIAFGFGHAFRSGGRLTGRSSRLMPGLAAVVRALDDLPEPAARLRCIDSI